MMSSTFSVYSKEQLPTGFNYPVTYLQLAQDTSALDAIPYFAWWFEDASTEGGELAYFCRNCVEGMNLIPFARNGDWAANFDGNDTSGDPKVYVLDLGDLPHCVELKNFDDWLDKAKNHYF